MALVITIIVMIILAGITINVFFGEDGIITRSRLSTFGHEMTQIKEKVDLKKSVHAAQILKNSETRDIPEADFNATLFSEKFNTNETSKYKVKDSLLREIIYARAGFPSDVNIDSYGQENFESIINDDGTITNVFVIDKDTADGNENTYVWDFQTDIVYKIPQTRIGTSVYHSYTIASLGLNPTGAEVKFDLLIEDEPEIVTNNGISYYEPDLTGYSKAATKIIYYSQTYLTEAASNSSRALQRSDYIELPIAEYINKGKPASLLGSQFPDDGQTINSSETYVFHDYANQVWGNVKTDSSGLECWWVWIPRYAYKINGANSTPPIDIEYIDLNNKINQKTNLPDGYIPHPGFTETQINDNDEEEVVKELKGIWMSKYEPSYTNEFSPEGNGCYAPDMEGFDKENTYIELYDTQDEVFKDSVQLKTANLSTINNQYSDQNEIWYDYSNNIWANVKTQANGLECWWVWIPRYAYKIVDGVTETDIIFVDVKNKPIDKAKFGNTLPEGYIVHPAFTEKETNENDEEVIVKELKGIWMSKYEPSNNTSSPEPTSNVCYAPDMEGFDPDTTYIEIYDSEGNTIQEQRLLKDVDLSTINNDNAWYDYSKQKWANIKTMANGIECWWVWIPRYAYVITSGITETQVVFTDVQNRPIDSERYGDKLPSCYIAHPAFTEKELDENEEEQTVKELKGIWMSKYEPSITYESTPMSTVCYEPDMTGFNTDTSSDYTSIIYYSQSYLTAVAQDSTRSLQRSDYIELPISQYISKGKPRTLLGSEFPTDGQTINPTETYVFYDYANQVWGNVKTMANNLECWWVWIPRYAYVLTESQQEALSNKLTETNIVFTDTTNKPMDTSKFGNTLPSIYTPHPAFTEKETNSNNEEVIVKELQGIWMSKFEPSWVAE